MGDNMKWIKVEDELPEEYESVIGYDPTGDRQEDRNEMFYARGELRFVRDGIESCNSVTHWMPFPDPPK